MRVPYIRFWLNDFYDATSHLTREARHSYRDMIDKAYMTGQGSLPNDEGAIRRMIGVSPWKWAAQREQVMPFWFVGEDGRLHNKRLDLEWRKATDREFRDETHAAESAAKKQAKANGAKAPHPPHPELSSIKNLSSPEPNSPAITTRAHAAATEAGEEEDLCSKEQRDLPTVSTEVKPPAPLRVQPHAPRPAPSTSPTGYILNYPDGDYPPWVLPPKNGA